ncbi:MAG: YgiQ family radical SAM protein [Desulfotalea sp.]|nr:MAG: YgiQ family radical SAM protein [Desulfotalea sp.]
MQNNHNTAPPLPISWEECKAKGWQHIDVLLVTGDAYIDHPSFGIALIGRVLEDQGYKVAILSQPRFDSGVDFKSYPAPRLFCGITAGNLDSIVANYTGNGKVRTSDSYSPDGNPWRGSAKEKKERRRPDRATLIYTSLARSAYGKIPLVLGGIEGSLRRFVHFDYKQNKLRASFLTDAKADLLVYGMGEKAIIEIANRCAKNLSLTAIPGTCLRVTDKEIDELFAEHERAQARKFLTLPSYEKILQDNRFFLEAEIETDKHLRAYSSRIVLQRQQTHWVVQYPQPKPLQPAELDQIYALPFSRKPHPAKQNIPAYHMIKDSVTIVRGCSGNCSFCSITRHQGPAIVSRSHKSILHECNTIAQSPDFSGTISDLGGPTANLYGTTCAIGTCKKRDCLYPKVCTHLQIDEELFLQLLKDVANIKTVKHLFISSGLRMELLLKTPKLMERIISSHTPGSIKIAPEHTDPETLRLMHKEPHSLLEEFVAKCRKIGKKTKNKTVELTPYVISSHPGSAPHCNIRLVNDMKKLDLTIRKFQDFTPTPGSLSTAMYVAEIDPESKKRIVVSKGQAERLKARRIIEKEFFRNNVPGKKRRKK